MELILVELLGNRLWSSPFYHFPCFLVRNIISMFYYQNFCLLFPTLTSCVDQVVTATVGIFVGKSTFISVVVRFLITTFPIHFSSSTIVFIVAIFLGFVASWWIWNLLFHNLYFHFFWYFWCIKFVYVNFGLCHFSLFLLTFFLLLSLFDYLVLFSFQKIVHNKNSLFLTTPLLMFRDLWGYILTGMLWPVSSFPPLWKGFFNDFI